MSSTNVHSKSEEENIYCAAAQIVPTDKEVEIPPKSAKKGPTSQEIILGEGMEIKAEESTLNEKGQLVGKEGNLVANYRKEQVSAIIKARQTRKTEKHNILGSVSKTQNENIEDR